MPRSSAAFCGRPMKRAVRLRSLSICPRCQFRLALQTKRPTYQQSFRTFTTQRSLRQETALLEVPAGDVSIPFPAPQDPSTTPLPLQISYESYGSPVIRYEPHDPPSAEQQRARKHSLGLDVLGKPAEVLIVEREKRKRRSLSLPLSHIKSDVPKDGPEAHDILRHVDREKESTTLEDVYRNIEDMRDSWLGNQRDAEDVFEDNEWEELASLLRESFSRRQLQTYIERLEDEGAPDTEYLKESYAGRTISRAVWKAGHSPITEARAPQLLKKGSKTNPEVQTNTTRLQYDDKDTLIDKLVSNYWNIRRISLETDVGFLDIKLPQSHFDLILHSRTNILKNTSEKYGVKIEIYRPSNIIRVVGAMDVCGDIYRLLKFVNEGIQSGMISLNATSSGPLATSAGDHFIQSAERSTNTILRFRKEVSMAKKPSRYMYMVMYFSNEYQNLAHVKDALRATFESSPQEHHEHLWGYRKYPTDLIALDVETTSSPQDGRWIRWITPSSRKRSNQSSKTTDLDESEIHNPRHMRRLPASTLAGQVLASRNNDSALFLRKLRDASEDDDSQWEVAVQEISKIKFGQVIVPSELADDTREAYKEYVLAQGDYDRLLDGAKASRGKGTTMSQADAHLWSQELLRQSKRKLERKSLPQEPELNTRLEQELETASMKVETSKAKLEDINKRSRSQFLPVSPSFIRSMNYPSTRIEGRQGEENICITLRPASCSNAALKPHKDLPILVLWITMPANGKPKRISPQFLVEEENIDISLPGNITDLSFSRRKIIKSRSRANFPSINEFIDKFDYDTAQDIPAPSDLRLHVPAFVLRSQPKPRPYKRVSRGLEVTYNVASIERRFKLSSTFLDTTLLTHSSIKGRSQEGWREEFTLSNLSNRRQKHLNAGKAEPISSPQFITRNLIGAAMRLIDETEDPALRKHRILHERVADLDARVAEMNKGGQELLDSKIRLRFNKSDLRNRKALRKLPVAMVRRRASKRSE